MRRFREKQEEVSRRVFSALRRRCVVSLREALADAQAHGFDVSEWRNADGACVVNAIARAPSIDHLNWHLLSAVWPFRPQTACADNRGADALLNALSSCAEPLALRLVGYGSPEGRDLWGRTPLMLALANKMPLAARKLLPLSDLGALDRQGWSALHWAAQAGDASLADETIAGMDRARQCALRPGADGLSAFDVAVGGRHWAVAELLADRVDLPRLQAALARWSRYRKVWDQSPFPLPKTAARLEREPQAEKNARAETAH